MSGRAEMRMCKGKCADCEWHLPKQEWCLAKGVVILRPLKEIVCRYFYLKRSTNNK